MFLSSLFIHNSCIFYRITSSNKNSISRQVLKFYHFIISRILAYSNPREVSCRNFSRFQQLQVMHQGHPKSHSIKTKTKENCVEAFSVCWFRWNHPAHKSFTLFQLQSDTVSWPSFFSVTLTRKRCRKISCSSRCSLNTAFCKLPQRVHE